MDRAYCTWLVKAVDDEQRIIEGIASSPSPDSADDILEPAGAIFSLPMPLLFQHDQRHPIGQVLSADVRADGIRIRAQIAKGVTQAIEDAWRLIKAGLVGGFSVGLKPIEVKPRKGKPYALHVTKWHWRETSAVTIPANAEASILLIKSLDAGHRAALGPGRARVRSQHPGAAGSSTTGGTMNASDQITALRTQLQTKHARMDELNSLEATDGLTLTDDQQTEFDNLTTDVTGLTTRLKRLEVMESSSALLATPVATLERGAVLPRARVPHVEVRDQTPPGIGFARVVICKMAALVNGVSALEIAKARYPHDDRIPLVLKAAVAAGNTTDATWAGPLVYANQLATEFIEYLRPQTIVGRFGQGSVPSLRRVPFNVRITGQTSGASANWVGQGVPKPVTKFDTAATTLGFSKIAAISVITEELARFSSPSAEGLVRDELGRAIIARMDIDFIDPAKALVANVSPASITNGVTPTAATITDADSVRAALGALLAAYLAANNPPQSAVLIMPATTALNWSLMFNALGQPEFSSLSMNGGSIQGIPVITTQHAVIAGNELVIMVNASDIFLADEGGVTVDVSREASITMSSDPVADAATASVVSMWQANMLALRAERFVNWAKRRAGAAQYISIDVTP